jgi:hypothetical protein
VGKVALAALQDLWCRWRVCLTEQDCGHCSRSDVGAGRFLNKGARENRKHTHCHLSCPVLSCPALSPHSQADLVLSRLASSCRQSDPQLLSELRGELLYMARVIEEPVSLGGEGFRCLSILTFLTAPWLAARHIGVQRS